MRARLIYVADDPTGTCGSESEFRGKVAARLGYDPFRADAAWLFRVRIDGSRKPPRAEILTEQDGRSSGRRVLEDTKCDALLETAASAVAIAIDPVATSTGPSTSPPPAASPSSPLPGEGAAGPLPSATPPAAPTPSEPPAAPVVPELYLDPTVAFGRTAGVSLGGRAGFGLRYRAMSASTEARGEATPDAVRLTALDRAYWSVFSGALVACGHKGIFEFCGTLALGTLQAKAKDVTRPSLKGTLFGSIGPRLGVQVPITTELALRANGELGIPLVRTTFTIAGQPAWTAPAVHATLAIGLEVRFR